MWTLWKPDLNPTNNNTYILIIVDASKVDDVTYYRNGNFIY